ncbi:MAG: hypothetical protein AVDCRST_MAG41-2712, partial [uncultured Corynebacteriales bacterium]
DTPTGPGHGRDRGPAAPGPAPRAGCRRGARPVRGRRRDRGARRDRRRPAAGRRLGGRRLRPRHVPAPPPGHPDGPGRPGQQRRPRRAADRVRHRDPAVRPDRAAAWLAAELGAVPGDRPPADGLDGPGPLDGGRRADARDGEHRRARPAPHALRPAARRLLPAADDPAPPRRPGHGAARGHPRGPAVRAGPGGEDGAAAGGRGRHDGADAALARRPAPVL